MDNKRLRELAGVQLNENESEFEEVVRLMKRFLAKHGNEFLWLPTDEADYEKSKYAIKAMAKEIVEAIK